MKTREARELGGRLTALVQAGKTAQAYSLLAPLLGQRTPFAMLRCIGEPIGASPMQPVNDFLALIAIDRTEGGWVIISSALERQLGRDLDGAFARCRDFIIAGDIWYATDILAEGVVGQALAAHFQPSLQLLAPWRQDPNPWVRRAVGVGAHFWAKRSHGAAEHIPRAGRLLAFLKPMFEEWDMNAVKGVGWGLKTLGRYYPDLVADWLAQQVIPNQRHHRTLMLRKALTHLSKEQRTRVKEAPHPGSQLPAEP
ncbi:MAG: DNA alkylation repair protein [Anaerolineales bacterium]|nr:MAG: DNA alkylation repair protein [Anaerolineales bacterium]